MSEYAKIPSASKNGALGISKKVFISIAEKATSAVAGAELKKYRFNVFDLANPVSVSFSKNGKVTISIVVNLVKNANVVEVCSSIQQEVANSIAIMCDVVPVSINVKVSKII